MMPAMNGLKQAMPAYGTDADEGMGMMGMGGMQGGGTEQAVGLLEQAMQLHAGHLSGEVPVSPESQEQLMQLIEGALSALQGQ